MGRVTPDVAAAELLRRRRAREDLCEFANSVEVPGAPDPDREDVFTPIDSRMAVHHRVMLGAIQRTLGRKRGRLLMLCPPGTAKSTMLDVVACPWVMGRRRRYEVIMASYAQDVAVRQSRRARALVQSRHYTSIFPKATLKEDTRAADEWELSNGSSFTALGIGGAATGRRCDLLVIDDPVKGYEEAMSAGVLAKVASEYRESLRSRLKPDGSIVMVMTRWSENDLMGEILPDDWRGESGMIAGKDGQMWEVLCLPAQCERDDDPLGRKVGEFIWPEYFPEDHWLEVKNDPRSQRTWSALYQQFPVPVGDERFNEGMFDYYKPGCEPAVLNYVGAGDYAVSEGKNDFTELGVFGVDDKGDLWEVDWWSRQCTPDVGMDATLDMISRWKIPMWFHEGGVIDKAVTPYANVRMRERGIFVDRRSLPSMKDKGSKCASFQARSASGRVHFRDNANSRRVVQQLIAGSAGRHDDAMDVCGLIGRGLDQFPITYVPKPVAERSVGPKFGTWEWLSWKDKRRQPVRYF